MSTKEFVSDWNEFVKFCGALGKGWIFRGQCNKWPLKTSLERACESFGIEGETVSVVEKRLLRDFRRKFHLYSQYLPRDGDTEEWLSLMQHYGAPTRFLDWTYSFYIAAFFAIEKALPSAACVVWALNGEWVNERARFLLAKAQLIDVFKEYENTRDGEKWEQIFMRDKPVAFVKDANPFRLNERLAVQQGVFLSLGDVTKSFLDNLSALGDSEDNLIEISVDAQTCGKKALENLHRMNVNRLSLFPGLDGFAGSLWTALPILSAAPVGFGRDVAWE